MSNERPVLTGLIALAGVGLVVGLLVSLAALAGTSVLGLGGGEAGTTSRVGTQESMILPTPEPTAAYTGPLVTLAPDLAPGATAPGEPGVATDAPPAPPPAAPAISLSASVTAARPGETITLSGVYPGGEGATLAVERFVGGTWTSFVDITTTVSGETFSTSIRTSQSGDNLFRVRDLASDLASNEVTFTIG